MKTNKQQTTNTDEEDLLPLRELTEEEKLEKEAYDFRVENDNRVSVYAKGLMKVEKFEVSWSSIGAVSPEEAKEFALKILAGSYKAEELNKRLREIRENQDLLPQRKE